MQRDQVIDALRSHEDEIRANGIVNLYLFGSHARNEAEQSSDVDLFFDRAPDARIGLFRLIGLQHRLEEILGTKVDLAAREGLHYVLRPDIEASAIQVF